MEHKLLMIPGPVEFDPEVNAAVGEPTVSHVAPDFIESFGRSLELMRKVWEAPDGQPFILAGSGTLAMDAAACNLIEPGDHALVLSTGYFGERYAELLTRYGARVKVLRSEPGYSIDIGIVEAELKKHDYKLLTFTHVDTSTAVRVDPEPLGRLGREYNVLTILDGVCSVAAEEIYQQEWGIDVVLTASQKAIGVPPGLALLVVSEKAMNTWRGRKTKVANYYADWTNWLPIMEAYEDRRASYFGTPAVNLVKGLDISLQQILAEGNAVRFARHKLVADSFRAGLEALNIKQIPVSAAVAANTLSAPYYPEGISGAELIAAINKSGVVVAGGLHPDLKSKYFRVGHMGSVSEYDHILDTIGAIESALAQLGYDFTEGSGREATYKLLNNGSS